MKHDNNQPIIIEVCTGTTCFLLGAADLETLEQQIKTRWLGKVILKPSRCLGLCKSGRFNGAPYAKINSVPVGKANAEQIIQTIEEMIRTAAL